MTQQAKAKSNDKTTRKSLKQLADMAEGINARLDSLDTQMTELKKWRALTPWQRVRAWRRGIWRQK